MDATCRICGNPAEVGAVGGDAAACRTCAKRAQRRRLIFDVSESGTPRCDAPTSMEKAIDELSSPPEETRMLDLRDLARRTRRALATVPEVDEVDVPLSVREAILLVDSIAPASTEPAPAAVDPSPPSTPTSSSPGRRLHALYSGVGLLVVMAGLVVAEARMSQDVASAAGLTPDPPETTALLSAAPPTPSTDVMPVAVTPGAKLTATAAPSSTSAPRKAPPKAPPPRPRAPIPADTPEIQAAAEPKVVLLDAMAAAVAARSAPTTTPKVDCPPAPPGGSGTPSPCARAGTRTSPLRP